MAFIYDAVRAPRGKGKKEGALASMKPDELVSALVGSIKQRTGCNITPDALILGASGAILVSALLDALDVAKGRYGLVVATGASGTGSAMIVERIG